MATSSCHSETIAAFDAAKEAVHLRGLLEFAGFPCSEATVLEEDNKGAIELSQDYSSGGGVPGNDGGC